MTDTTKQALSLRRCNELSEYPLSLGQDNVWLQCQLYPESNVYKLAVELSVSGPLDFTAFSRALEAVVDRHEILRTVFDAPDGIPIQRVLGSVTISLPVTDLSAHPSEDRIALTISNTERLLSAPFDLAHGPLFRAVLLRFGTNDHYFILAFHRLIMDGFHSSRFAGELARNYFSILHGEPLPQPLKFQYGDFAVGQRERLSSGMFEKHTLYWQRQLQEPAPQTLLPADHPVPATRTFSAGSFMRILDPALCAALRALEKPCRTTLFRIVLAAFAALLGRLCGEDEVIIAVPFSTRPREMSGAIGFFSNVLPLRISLRSNPTFRKFLMEIDLQLRHAPADGEFALTEVLQQRPRSQKFHGRPLLPIAVSQIGAWELSAEGVRMASSRGYSTGMMHDICLALAEQDDRYYLYYLYAAEIFETKTVARWAKCLAKVLKEVAARPDAPLSCLDSLSKPLNSLAANTHEPASQSAPERDLTPPRSELERRLVAIWRETLGCGPIGIDDNFLQLGANSLMMAKVHRKLSALMAEASTGSQYQPPLRLSLRSIFDNPTIRNLAALVSPWFPEPGLIEEPQREYAKAEFVVQS